MSNAEELIEQVYESGEGSEVIEDYHARHNVNSLLILTITDAYAATREVDRFASQIRGKTVIEIGAGVGFLALEMAKFAKQVYAIEADPSWSRVFTDALYHLKPKNVTWIFGAADTVSHCLRGDVAIVYTRSAKEEMVAVAKRMCPVVILGPYLNFDEMHANLPEEIRATVKDAAAKVKLSDIRSRRGI